MSCYTSTKISKFGDTGLKKIFFFGDLTWNNPITLFLKLKDDTIKPMGRGEVAVAVMADFSRALLTIDHCTVVKKLKSLGFS